MPEITPSLRICLFLCLLQPLSAGEAWAMMPSSAPLVCTAPALREEGRAMPLDSIPWTSNMTGDNHTIIIRADVYAAIDSVPIEPGDLIGFFYEDNGVLRCSNFVTWEGMATGRGIYGNDADPGSGKNGFDEGELIQVRLYKTSTAQEFAATAEYAPPVSPISHTDRYAKDGISLIVAVSATMNDILNPDCNSITVEATVQADTCQAGTGVALIEGINAGVAFSVEWQNGQAGNQIEGLSNGTYEAILSTDNGCILPVSLDVPSADCPLLQAEATANGVPGGVQGCVPFAVNFEDVSIAEAGIQSYSWDFGDSNTSDQPSPAHTFQAPGIYTVTFIISDVYRADTLAFEVVVHELPQVELDEQWGICAGETAFIGVTALPGYSYAWSDGSTGAMIEVAHPGVYVLSVTESNGCSGSGSTLVEVVSAVEASIQVLSGQVCPGDTVRLLGSGAADLRWIDTSLIIAGLTVPELSFVPQATSTYGLIASNECFSDTAYIEIKAAERLVFVSPDTCIAFRGRATLSAEGAVSYQWWNAGFNISVGNGASVVVSPDSTAYFYVEMTDSLGCSYLDSIWVEVLYLSELNLPAVNIITPNGDGFNDVLEFPNLTKFDAYKLTVFNRHGAVVYESVNYQNDWDGTRNGKPLPDGVYFYILRIGQLELKSTLTIIRD